jgi:hypothetical protein
MRPLPYKHYFNVSEGKFNWEDPQMLEVKRKLLEGKRGYAIIEEDTEDVSLNQLAYYFGGIIRQECMNSECFAGLSEKEIHNYLLTKCEGSMRKVYRPDKTFAVIEMPGDFDLIMGSKKRMALYIEKVIATLQTEHDIFPKPAEHYKKTNKFRQQIKHY